MEQLSNDERCLDKSLKKYFSLQKGESQDNNWELFRKKYHWLILKIARRVLGDRDFNSIDYEDIFQEACVSYLIAQKYHNHEKKTKQTTSFVWMFKKLLKAHICYDYSFSSTFRNSDNNEINIDNYISENDLPFQDSIYLDQEEHFIYNSDLIANNCYYPDELDGCRSSQNGLRYLVCTESLFKYIDIETLKCLKALNSSSDKSNDTMISICRGNYRSTRSFIKRIQKSIKIGLEQNNVKLFQAVCLNGSRNVVFVAGKDINDAKKYLEPFGTVLEMKPCNIK